jgi:hypothetical protein
MRLIKMLGLAAVAALAVMALVGPSSAMAKEEGLLCEQLVHDDPCTAVTKDKIIHFLSVVKNAEGLHVDGKGKLLAGSSTVECLLLVEGKVLDLDPGPEEKYLGSPIKVLAELHYTSCNLGCTVTSTSGELKIHGELDILKTGLDLATVTGLGYNVKLACPFVFTCDYNAEKLEGHAHHLIGLGKADEEELAHVTYEEDTVNLVEKLSGPFNCPTTGALDALLKSLTPLHIKP